MTNDAELVAEGLLQGLTQLLPGVATILGLSLIHIYVNARTYRVWRLMSLKNRQSVRIAGFFRTR